MTSLLRRTNSFKLVVVLITQESSSTAREEESLKRLPFFPKILPIIPVIPHLIIPHVKYRAQRLSKFAASIIRLSKSRDNLAFNELNRTRDVSWRWIIIVACIEYHGGTPRPRSPYEDFGRWSNCIISKARNERL